MNPKDVLSAENGTQGDGGGVLRETPASKSKQEVGRPELVLRFFADKNPSYPEYLANAFHEWQQEREQQAALLAELEENLKYIQHKLNCTPVEMTAAPKIVQVTNLQVRERLDAVLAQLRKGEE